jgi:hypothetical protein
MRRQLQTSCGADDGDHEPSNQRESHHDAHELGAGDWHIDDDRLTGGG